MHCFQLAIFPPRAVVFFRFILPRYHLIGLTCVPRFAYLIWSAFPFSRYSLYLSHFLLPFPNFRHSYIRSFVHSRSSTKRKEIESGQEKPKELKKKHAGKRIKENSGNYEANRKEQWRKSGRKQETEKIHTRLVPRQHLRLVFGCRCSSLSSEWEFHGTARRMLRV